MTINIYFSCIFFFLSALDYWSAGLSSRLLTGFWSAHVSPCSPFYSNSSRTYWSPHSRQIHQHSTGQGLRHGQVGGDVFCLLQWEFLQSPGESEELRTVIRSSVGADYCIIPSLPVRTFKVKNLSNLPRISELGTLILGSHTLDHYTILHRLLGEGIGEVAYQPVEV